jgi:membrane protein implicated in regulation of membrane protease activity
MSEATLWWVICGVAVAVELTTGSFYLLMLALGFAAAALAAHAGLSAATQMVVAAAVGGASVLVLRRLRGQSAPPLDATQNRDVNLDIGETVHVDTWGLDGTAQVMYRGARWSAALAQSEGAAAPTPGNHRIVEVQGNRLILVSKD